MKTQAQIRRQANIDEDLLLADTLKTGNAADKNSAFNIVVSKYYNQVLFRINGFVHNMELAKDLTQETFLKVSTSINKFKSKAGAFSTWVNTIAKNIVIDHVRKERRFNLTTFSKLEASFPGNEDGEHNIILEINSPQTPQDELLKQEIRDTVQMALDAQCTPVEQRIFNEICVNGKRYDEVAAAEGIPIGTVKSIVHRTKNALVDWFKHNRPNFQTDMQIVWSSSISKITA